MTDDQLNNINAFYRANGNDPQAIRLAMQQYGVTGDDVSQATGIGRDTLTAVLGENAMNGNWNTGGPLGGAAQPPAQSPAQSGFNGNLGLASFGGNQSAAPSQPSSSYMSSSSWSQNPYLTQMGDALTNQMTTNLNRNILPGIRGNAMAAGGYGGSRQGVSESNAINDLNTSLGNSLANLYGQGYNTSMNAALTNQGQQNQYNLGLGNLALGNLQANNSYNLGMGNLQLGNRNTDLNSVQLGANLYNLGNAGYTGQGTGVQNIGNTQQQAPWTAINNATNNYSPYTGLGTSNIGTQSSSQAANALGGAIAGNQIYNSLNRGSSTPANTFWSDNSNLGYGSLVNY